MMNEEKGKYYWLKLRLDFFDSPAIDFLFEQENGSEYVALYLKICAMVANTNGMLVKQINEIQIPYDVKRIAKDAKYFSIDTVGVALELYKKLGLILEEENGLLKVANYERMVGAEKDTDHIKKLSAERQRRFRERKKQALLDSKQAEEETSNATDNVTVTQDSNATDNVTVTQDSNVTDNVTVTQDSNVTDNVTVTSQSNVEYRDKRLEYRDKNIENIKRESIERKNKDKNLARSYGDYNNVILNDEEYQELQSVYGDAVNEHIQILDEYIERTGKKYNSCFLAIKKWVHNAYLEKRGEKNGGKGNIKIDMPEYMKQQKEGTLKTKPVTKETLEKAKALQKKLGDETQKE